MFRWLLDGTMDPTEECATSALDPVFAHTPSYDGAGGNESDGMKKHRYSGEDKQVDFLQRGAVQIAILACGVYVLGDWVAWLISLQKA